MKGIILAGGHGTRLRPMTNIMNKHLIAVYNMPMIEYPLATLVESGIKDILVVSGREHAGNFLEYLGSGKDRGLNFTYRVQEDAGGIAQALGLAEDFANGEDILVILGDNYFEYSPEFSPLIGQGKAGIVLKKVLDSQRFGVANFEEGKGLVSLEEKPKNPKSDLAITGLYFYPSDVFEVIRTLKPSDRGELEITDVNNYYFDNYRISTTTYDGFWSDMGTPESLAKTIEWIIKLQ